MEVIEYPLTDAFSQTTFHGLQKITASNGEFCFVTRDEVYQTLQEYIERQITWHSYMTTTYQKNCSGLKVHQTYLEIWKRILAETGPAISKVKEE